MRTKGENIDKTAFTFSARKRKKDSIFLKFFFENEFLKDMEIYQKKTNLLPNISKSSCSLLLQGLDEWSKNATIFWGLAY